MALHTKYRPTTLSKLIGHEEAVTRMQGIINSGKVPSAILITGPTSVGKTTLARAFASDLSGLGEKFLSTADYKEVNFSDTRGIDDIRALINLTQYMPQFSKYRVFVGDEAQGLLSTPASANCIEANTYILTDQGARKACDLYRLLEQGKPISFLSFNEETGQTEYKAVTDWQEKLSTEGQAKLGESEALVTLDHPIGTIDNDDQGWHQCQVQGVKIKYVKARDIIDHSCLVYSLIGNSRNGLDYSDTGIKILAYDMPERPVYDFEVEDNHNFFVAGKKRSLVFTLVHNCVLKSLEESKNTLWILCSMNPEKFKTTTIGKAIANRCVQFNLEPHTNKDLLKQALRICKGESMQYMIDDGYTLLKEVVKASNYEMRTLAQLIEACQQYYDGLKEKPEVFDSTNIASILKSVESSDDQLAVEFMINLFSLKFGACQLAILNCSDHVGFSAKLSYIAQFLVNYTALNGQKHHKVWMTQQNKRVLAATQKLKVTLGMLGEVATRLTECRSKIMGFGIGADALLSQFAYSTIRKLQEMQKA